MLPGLAPNITRGNNIGIGGNRLRIEGYVDQPGDFSRTECGLWLPPYEVARIELEKSQQKLGQIAAVQAEAGMPQSLRTAELADIIGSSTLSPAGCLTGGAEFNSEGERLKLVRELASYQSGTFILDSLEDLEYLRICDCLDCYEPRHYDLSFGRPKLREKRIGLDPRWFKFNGDDIKTIWGNELPTVRESLQEYIELQRRCFPFTTNQESALTPGAMAQVTFDPLTGCWPSWSYYCSSQKGMNWQFDGYGRLYQRQGEDCLDMETGEIIPGQRRGQWLAHRVVWAAMMYRELEKDKVLNHLCSYRRCCNPGHIEQVSSSENNRHGRFVQNAINKVGASSTTSADNQPTPRQLAPYWADANRLYHQICAEQGLQS
jgi:hypothetical protein